MVEYSLALWGPDFFVVVAPCKCMQIAIIVSHFIDGNNWAFFPHFTGRMFINVSCEVL